MQPVGAVRLVPRERVYRQIFEDEGRLRRSLDEVRNKTRLSRERQRLALDRDAEISADARLLPCYQQSWVGRTAYNDSTEKPPSHREDTTFQKAWTSVDVSAAEEVRSLPDFVVPEETRSDILECLSEHRRRRHEEALASMYHELDCIAREMEPFVLEPGKLLRTKLMESDRKIKLLFKKIEMDTILQAFSMEDLEELWNIIHQESVTRRKWIREMDESLKRVEWSRADKITDVLRKYTVILEEISFFLSADVHRFINHEAMMINRTLLGNQRAIAKLFFNLMKSEMETELSHRLNWQDRVKDWNHFQKACRVQSFRELMTSEEIQNSPPVKTEMENMIKDQILLNERRLELLRHLGELLPPTHTKAETEEWYRSLVDLNRSIDTHNVQCMMKIRTQYEVVQQKCLAEAQLCMDNLLNLDAHTKKEAEEVVNSELLQLTGKLQSQIEEELEHMDRDFEELAKQNERNCGDLYSYFQEAMGLWDAHQLKLSQQQGELQKKLDEHRWKRDNLTQKMETRLNVILGKMRKASSEEDLEQCLKKALASLNKIRDRYEKCNQVLVDDVMAYPEAVLQELISYSMSISEFFNVKEIFKQNLQGETDFTSQDQELVKASEAECLVEQQAESIVLENEGKQKTDSCQGENEDTNTAENEEVFAQETEETNTAENEEVFVQESEETNTAENEEIFVQESEETNTAENEEIFAQETEETEEKEDGESIPHESEETEHAGQGAMFNGSKVESSKIAVETFSTSSGNTYTVLGVEETGQTDIPETYLTKYEKKESLPIYLRHVLIEESVFVELKKWIRLCFFEHLEKWFAESLSKAFVFVAAKKEELNSKLQLLLQFLQQRRENIEINTYNVRAAELSLHKERLERHCAAVVEALKKENAEFLKFRDRQKNIGKNLESRICEIESMFLSAPMTEKLVSLGNNLHSELHNHLEEMQVSLSSYQNYLEEALGKLRNSNVDFRKACRLFLDGGNFSPQEVKSFSNRLQEKKKQINSFESSIKNDMEKMESKSLEKATELINQSERKLSYLFRSRVFMEEFQRLLRNIRVQIKSEVVKSSLQAETLKSNLEKLHQKINACAHPAADKEALTAEDVYDFAKAVLKELKERSQYLDCLLVKATSQDDNEDFTPLATDVTLQGPVAVAIQAEHLRDQNKVMFMGLDPEKYPLLNPSKMGKSALDDLSISVIKKLLGIQQSRKSPGLSRQGSSRSRSLGRDKAVPDTPRKDQHSNFRLRKRRKPVTSDERFQIFGMTPPESGTFKGTIMNILWTGNNNLLCLAEEFYKRKKPQITVPEGLPETFEHCAEMLKQKLFSHQSQMDDHYNSYLREFQDQLKLFEKKLPCVSQLAVHSLFKEHEEKLSYSTGQIRHLFNKQLEDWERAKAALQNRLHPSLGHPHNVLQLDALHQQEIKREKDQADGIHLNTQMLRDCAVKCAQNFVPALAALTEKLLLELDESITVDDVQVAKTETPRVKTSTLLRRKQAGLPLEISEVEQLIARGSRTWPGIPMTTLPDNPARILCRETASVTTAKTTLGHVAAVEARDVVYKKYKHKLEQEFAQIKEESTAQLLTLQRWEDWWKRSVQKIKKLYR